MAHVLNVIDKEDMALINISNTPNRSLVIPYWKYEAFDLYQIQMASVGLSSDSKRRILLI